MTIQPGFGYGRILPDEKILLDVFYSPHSSQLACCSTSRKRDAFTLTCITALSASNVRKINQNHKQDQSASQTRKSIDDMVIALTGLNNNF